MSATQRRSREPKGGHAGDDMYNFSDMPAFNNGSTTTTIVTDPFAAAPPGTAMRRPTGMRNAEEITRPMTSNRGAGYTSHGGSRSVRVTTPGSPAGRPGSSSKKNEIDQDEAAKKAEASILALVESSVKNLAEGNVSKATEEIKTAVRREKALCKQREQAGLGEQNNPDLTYSVTLVTGAVFQAAGMPTESQAAYTSLVRNKRYVQAGRLRVNMGNVHFANEEYDQAVKQYQMALDQVPITHNELRNKILRNIGIASVKLGNLQEAVEAFEAVMDDSPEVDTGANLLVCYYAVCEVDKMKRTFRKLLGVRPFGLDPVAEDADDSADAGTGIAAVPDILTEEVRRRRKHVVDKLLTVGKLIGPVVEAEWDQGFDWVIAAAKESVWGPALVAELEMTKALTYLKKQHYDKAISTLKSFQKRDSALVSTASTNLSFLYFLENDIERAEQCADTAVKADRYNAKAIVQQGNCAFARNDIQAAQAAFEEALAVEADCSEALYNLGLVMKRLGRFPEAIQLFHKLQNIVPHAPEVAYQLADCYDQAGEMPRALDAYTRLVSMVPTDARVWASLGNVYSRSGDADNAYQSYSEAYRYHPVEMDVISWISAFHVKNEAYEKAIAFFQRAASIDTKDAKWLMMQASCQRRTGALNAALNTYLLVAQRFPENLECLRILVHLYSDLGLEDKAFDTQTKLRRLEALHGAAGSNSPADPLVAVHRREDVQAAEQPQRSDAAWQRQSQADDIAAQAAATAAVVASSAAAASAQRPAAAAAPAPTDDDWGEDELGDDLLPM